MQGILTEFAAGQPFALNSEAQVHRFVVLVLLCLASLAFGIVFAAIVDPASGEPIEPTARAHRRM